MKDYVIQATGFKSPAEMYAEPGIDWNTLLLPKPHAMYSMRVKGQGALSFGIFNQDLLIIDTSRRPNPGELLVVALDGEFLLGKIESNGSIYLSTDTSTHTSSHTSTDASTHTWSHTSVHTPTHTQVFVTGTEQIALSAEREFQVIGVVARLVRLYQGE
jgi:DNA polymerase V